MSGNEKNERVIYSKSSESFVENRKALEIFENKLTRIIS